MTKFTTAPSISIIKFIYVVNKHSNNSVDLIQQPQVSSR